MELRPTCPACFTQMDLQELGKHYKSVHPERLQEWQSTVAVMNSTKLLPVEHNLKRLRTSEGQEEWAATVSMIANTGAGKSFIAGHTMLTGEQCEKPKVANLHATRSTTDGVHCYVGDRIGESEVRIVVNDFEGG